MSANGAIAMRHGVNYPKIKLYFRKTTYQTDYQEYT
jgi:hypothetical protein